MGRHAHLFERLCVKQDPSKLNNLGRVLGDVHAVLIASGCDVDHDIAVDVELVAGGRTRHFGQMARVAN